LSWNALGNLFFEERDFTDALNAYEKAIGLRPDEQVFYGNKALVYIQQKRWQDAEQLVNTQLDDNGKTQFIENAYRLFPHLQIHKEDRGIKISTTGNIL